MCGRFTLSASPQELRDEFGLGEVPDFPPRYNIAPQQPVAVIRRGAGNAPQFRLMQWGLIPHWSKDPSIGPKLINARCETLHEKPSFRSAFRYRRCLIPANGFYEWQKAKAGIKQPYYFREKAHRVFALAGLWETWGEIETCTIITTQPSAVVAPIHQRMPVIIAAEHYSVWLDSQIQAPQQLFHLFDPDAGANLVATPVNSRVNNPAVDHPQCIESLSPHE